MSPAAKSTVIKSDDAFRTISEVAEDLDVPKHVLRFWELKFPQVRPMKRGGGRRYYRPEDARLLRGIRALLYRDGYTIKGVQKILREQGVEAVKLIGEDGAEEPAVPNEPARAPARKAPAKKRQDATASTSDARAILKDAIAELEACRELLKSASADGDDVAQTARAAGA